MSSEKIPPPLCVWCSAPWTDDMVDIYAWAGCSGGDYAEITMIDITMDVICSSCKRLVYRKHVRQDENDYRD